MLLLARNNFILSTAATLYPTSEHLEFKPTSTEATSYPEPSEGWEGKTLSTKPSFIACGTGTITVDGPACVVENGGLRCHGIPVIAKDTVEVTNNTPERTHWFKKTAYPHVFWPFVGKVPVEMKKQNLIVKDIQVYQKENKFGFMLPKGIVVMKMVGNKSEVGKPLPGYEDDIVLRTERSK